MGSILITICSILFCIVIILVVIMVAYEAYGIAKISRMCRKPRPKKQWYGTEYPYLPFSLETEHIGWSYEYDRFHGWNYFIWLVKEDNSKIIIDYFSEKNRTRAIETCKRLEKEIFGEKEN